MLSRRHFIAAAASMVTLPAFADGGDVRMTMDGLYDEGKEFSDKAKMFNGANITLDGFMAPPLKPEVKFFVLGTQPMAICPFCDAAAQWPQNIVLVYPKDKMRLFNYDQALAVTGTLDLGVKTDDATGFVSKVRLIDATYKGLPSVAVGF
jgi:hypothetical protein